MFIGPSSEPWVEEAPKFWFIFILFSMRSLHPEGLHSRGRVCLMRGRARHRAHSRADPNVACSRSHQCHQSCPSPRWEPHLRMEAVVPALGSHQLATPTSMAEELKPVQWWARTRLGWPQHRHTGGTWWRWWLCQQQVCLRAQHIRIPSRKSSSRRCRG